MSKASIDIETTGLEPAGVAVTSVGIVMFDDGGVYANAAEVGFWRLNVAWTPGRRDKGTHAWWQQQRPELMAEAFGGATLPWDFCEQFVSWIQANDPDEVWANPARFDLGHLRELFYALGFTFPIDYRRERDLPTLKSVARSVAASISEAELETLNSAIRLIQVGNGSEHSALADAIEQAEQIRMLTSYLRRQLT